MRKRSRGMYLPRHRCRHQSSIHPVLISCRNRATIPHHAQTQAHLQHQAPFQVVGWRRLQMKSPQQPLGLSEERRPQELTPPITIEVASPGSRGLITAVLHLVFVSICRRFTVTQRPPMVLWRHMRSTRHRPFGGQAFMTLPPVNLRVDVPGMGVM